MIYSIVNTNICFRIRQFTSEVTSLTYFKCKKKGLSNDRDFTDAVLAIGKGYVQPNEQLTGLPTTVRQTTVEKQYALLFDADLITSTL